MLYAFSSESLGGQQMETFILKNFSFMYPNKDTPTIQNISLTISQGEVMTICGKSGCGKTTLLRQLKSALAPYGKISGEILFEGIPLERVSHREQSSKIGYVMQSPENQIVTDKVWHELAFGLESLGMNTQTIRMRVAEMASFFGIQDWFHKSVNELSGGQKQLLNLAAVMVMRPSVLILDEPTSQLDPIAATEFLNMIEKINRELGTTIIITEHRLEEVLPFTHTLIVMDSGKILEKGIPKEVGLSLFPRKHEMFWAMPSPMKIYCQIPNDLECPFTVCEGRQWINEITQSKKIGKWNDNKQIAEKEAIISLREVSFKYEKNAPDVIKELTVDIRRGELFAILGGNGTGKTTALSLITGLLKPYRGKITVNGANIHKIPTEIKNNHLFGVLPQNPQALFVKSTVEADLYDVFDGSQVIKSEQYEKVKAIAEQCQIKDLLSSHPYDLSGGEQQRVALAKVLLLEPEILLLDEPTKGMDVFLKEVIADILLHLKIQGTTIVMVSHDIEFCASYAERCAMFFDGSIVAINDTRTFFTGNSFYTTSANRMVRHVIPEAVTANDVVIALGGEPSQKNKHTSCSEGIDKPKKQERCSADKQYHSISKRTRERKKQLPKCNIFAVILIFLLIPLTIFWGVYYFDDRKYYLISMLVMIETMLPFIILFEGRKPRARELVIIAVLCAISVAGRVAFFMLPQFKPVVAIVIITGVCFGGEWGFLVGAVSGFVSNFFVGQGPWTPWQMFAFGIIGFFAGVLFKKGVLRKSTVALCVYGGLATFFIYGFLLNLSTVLLAQSPLNWEAILLACLRGVPFDFVHAMATVIFLALLSKPMLQKLDRVKKKYGLLEESIY